MLENNGTGRRRKSHLSISNRLESEEKAKTHGHMNTEAAVKMV